MVEPIPDLVGYVVDRTDPCCDFFAKEGILFDRARFTQMFAGGNSLNDRFFGVIQRYVEDAHSLAQHEIQAAWTLGLQVVVDPKSPCYTRALASRCLCLLLEKAPTQVLLMTSAKKKELLDALIELVNKCASNKVQEELSPQDIHRVSLNCSALIARLVHQNNQSLRPALNPRSELLHLTREPTCAPSKGISPTSRSFKRTLSPRRGGSSQDASSSEVSGAVDFPTTFQTVAPSRKTPTSSRKTPMSPVHRPLTRFSDTAKEMGLYDGDDAGIARDPLKIILGQDVHDDGGEGIGIRDFDHVMRGASAKSTDLGNWSPKPISLKKYSKEEIVWKYMQALGVKPGSYSGKLSFPRKKASHTVRKPLVRHHDHHAKANNSQWLGYSKPAMWYPQYNLPPSIMEETRTGRTDDKILLRDPQRPKDRSRSHVAQGSVRMHATDRVDVSELQRLETMLGRIRGSVKNISSEMYGRLHDLKRDLPLKFLIELKSRGFIPETSLRLIRDRAYLMLVAWADEMRLRMLAAALVPWWQLVVSQRNREYKIGIGVRIVASVFIRRIRRIVDLKWQRWVRIASWLRHKRRDEAARVIQRCYRGYVGRLYYAEYLRRFLAVIPIQTAWRRYIHVIKYARIKYVMITLQARVRGFLTRSYLGYINACATCIQSIVRMYAFRSRYVLVETSVCRLQTTYRAWMARKIFYRMIEMRIRWYEIELTAVLIVQRSWRAYCGRRKIQFLRQRIVSRENAALRIQLWWYTVNDQFATFLLMRLLGAEDQRENQLALEASNRKRQHALLFMQMYVRKWIKRREALQQQKYTDSAIQIQKRWRGISCRHSFGIFRSEQKAARIIQRRYRSLRSSRTAAARVLQRWFLMKEYRGRKIHLSIHIYNNALRSFRKELQLMTEWQYTNAVIIQCCARQWLARRSVHRVLSANTIKRAFRTYLWKLFLFQKRFRACHNVAEMVVPTVVESGRKQAFTYIQVARRTAAIKIQCLCRTYLSRTRYLVLKSRVEKETFAAVIIQKFYNRRKKVLALYTLLECRSRKRKNIFRGELTISKLIESVLRTSKTYYDPHDSLAGTGVATILRRLGFPELTRATKSFLKLQSKTHENLEALHEWPLMVEVMASEAAVDKLKALYAKKLGDLGGDRQRGSKKPTVDDEALALTAIERLKKLSELDRETVKMSEIICDEDELRGRGKLLFQSHFKSSAFKSESFATAISKKHISLFVLEDYVRRYSNGESKRCLTDVGLLGSLMPGIGWESSGSGVTKKVGFLGQESKWDQTRTRKCFEACQMGLEMVLELPRDPLRLEANLQRTLTMVKKHWHWRKRDTTRASLYPCPTHPPGKDDFIRLNKLIMSAVLDWKTWDTACLLIQRFFRRYRALMHSKSILASIVVRKAYREYLQERVEIKDGTRVVTVAQADRLAEAALLAEKEKQIARDRIVHRLSKTLRVGYTEHKDDQNLTFYVNNATGIKQSDRPSYTYQEFLAASKLQMFLRSRKANMEALRQKRLGESMQHAAYAEIAWAANAVNRSRLVTISINCNGSVRGVVPQHFIRRPVSSKVQYTEKRRLRNTEERLRALADKLADRGDLSSASHFVQSRIAEIRATESDERSANKIKRRVSTAEQKRRVSTAEKSKRIKEEPAVLDSLKDPSAIVAMFPEACCRLHPRCMLGRGHAGHHRLVPFQSQALCPFGWGRFHIDLWPSSSTDSLQGIAAACWVFREVKKIWDEHAIKDVDGDADEDVSKDAVSYLGPASQGELTDTSYTDYCRRALLNAPQDVLNETLERLRTERFKVRNMNAPRIRHKCCAKGVIGLIFREVVLRYKSRRNMGYTSVTTVESFMHEVASISLESPGMAGTILKVSKKSLRWKPPAIEVHRSPLSVQIQFTHVDMPFGWEEVRDHDGTVYYSNTRTGESTYEKQSYSAMDDFSAKIIQTAFRGYSGRKAFTQMLRKISLTDIAKAEITKATQRGWIGYGMEGMTISMYLARLGLYDVEVNVKSLSRLCKANGKLASRFISSLGELTDDELKSCGITYAGDRRRLRSMIKASIADETYWNSRYTPRHYNFQRQDSPKTLWRFASRDLYGVCHFGIPQESKFSGTLKSAKAVGSGFVVENGYKVDVASEFAFVLERETFLSFVDKYKGFSEKQKMDLAKKFTELDSSVTVGILRRYFAKHDGRPKVCCANFHEIADIETCSHVESEKTAFIGLESATKRLIGRVMVLQLGSLAHRLSTSLQYAETIINTLSYDVSSTEQSKKLGNLLQENGIISSNDGSLVGLRDLKYFLASRALREGLQWVICANSAAIIIQHLFQRHFFLAKGRQKRQNASCACSKIQAVWRGILGRRRAFATRAQRYSSWEQLYDEERLMYYFFDNSSRTSTWDAPKIPFKPYLWWPPEVEEERAAVGFCSVCLTEKATRACCECIDKVTGLGVEFCFACFALAHKNSPTLALHQFEVTSVVDSVSLICSECEAPATSKCKDCEDAFCKACFRRMHKRGKRQTHAYYTFDVNSSACIECKHEIATYNCLDCGDYFCNHCFHAIHERGKKKHHSFETVDSVREGIPLDIGNKKLLSKVGKKTGDLPVPGMNRKKGLDWRKLRPSRPPPPVRK